MSTIRPISDLRNHADRISDVCHKQAEPVFITKNGENDMVIMSQALYDRLQARLELYQKLDEADLDARLHPKGISHRQMIKKLRQALR